MLVPAILPFLFLAGGLTGFLGSLLGVGGGIFLVPILVLGFHVPMHFAVGTSLFTVIATSSAVGAMTRDSSAANLGLGIVLEATTLVGALLGGLLAGAISGDALKVVFGVVLVPIGALMWRRPGASSPDAHTPARAPAHTHTHAHAHAHASRSTQADGLEPIPEYQPRRLGIGLGVSSIAGLISGLLGVGGGILKVPALTLFCGIPTHVAVATSNFMIGLTAVASAFLYVGRGEVAPALTASVVLGVLAGSSIGARIGRKIRAVRIRRGFAVLMWFTASQMIWRAFGAWP